MLMLPLAMLIAFPTLCYAQAWNRANSPLNIAKNGELTLSSLPLKGEVSDRRLAWPGFHWNNNQGGIANRWSAAQSNNFTYRSPTLTQLQNMEQAQIDELSPAEKFDILLRDYRYTTVARVRSRLSPNENPWHGICHGYTAAALHHPEPQSVTVTNDDGIELKFYSADLTALLAYYYGKVASSPTSFVGKRCYVSPEDAGDRRNADVCWDVNAGAFHVVVTNQLGLKGQSFIADVSRFREVWNHVAVSYEADVIATSEPLDSSAPQTMSRVLVDMRVRYAGAIAPKFEAVIGTSNAEYLDSRYQYWLDLNAKGQILGGEWYDGAQPDFLWFQAPAKFTGKWSKAFEIYEESLKEAP